MSCTYSILESPMGVENYVATLRLIPVTEGDLTFAEWTAEFDAAPGRELIGSSTISDATSSRRDSNALKSRFAR